MATGHPGNRPDLGSLVQVVGRWGLDLLRPSIFARSKGSSAKPTARLAYLDGLRGFAAFLVYWQHQQLWIIRSVPSSQILENAYGYEEKYYFAALPGVRLFFTGGHFAVAVFFVISGYVLSAKSLSLIYSEAGDLNRLAEHLGSAMFRRWFRLHIPVILVSFAYMTSWHAFGGIWTVSPEHKASFWEEAVNWYTEFSNFSFVYRTKGDAWFFYDFPAWSIPVEFRGSMIVFTCLLALARARKNARLWCQVALIVYFLYIADGWFGAMFVAGMLLCELDLLARHDELPPFLSKMPRKTLFFYGMFVLAILLGGVPSHFNDPNSLTGAPGWRHLTFLKPRAMWDQKWFFLFWAAVCLVACIPRIVWLRAFFESRFNQYLGRISFAFYLIHAPILWTLGERLYAAVGFYRVEYDANIPGWVNLFPLSMAGPLGLEPAFIFPQLILLPFTLWLAEVGTKICDEPSVRVSQWLYNIVLPPPSSRESLGLRVLNS